jgi:transcriptional regulator with XRE-family HTH domain
MANMTAADFRRWRAQLRLTQTAAAERLGVSRLTISHYERGQRHDDKRPVLIPRHTELACAAVYLGVLGYNGETLVGCWPETEWRDGEPNLPDKAVSEGDLQEALDVLHRQGIAVGAHRMAFPLHQLIGGWSHIDAWCRESLRGHKLHCVLSRLVPGHGVGIVEFTNEKDVVVFKLRWVG